MHLKSLSDHVIIEDLGQECIVYNAKTKQAHCLNQSVKWIWQQCDGRKTVDEIVENFERHFGCTNAWADVCAGLRQLASANLVSGEVPSALPVQQPVVSRRGVMIAASLLAPVITSILVPPAAAAKSKETKPTKPPQPPKPPYKPPKK
jgi:hypothetical protein